MIRHPFGKSSLGQTGVSSGRTMTETNVVNFCMLTGNWLELHSNIEHAREAIYGQRLVQGSLVFSIVNAMNPFDSTVLAAFYSCDKLRFLRPTFINDTLWARVEIAQGCKAPSVAGHRRYSARSSPRPCARPEIGSASGHDRTTRRKNS